MRPTPVPSCVHETPHRAGRKRRFHAFEPDALDAVDGLDGDGGTAAAPRVREPGRAALGPRSIASPRNGRACMPRSGSRSLAASNANRIPAAVAGGSAVGIFVAYFAAHALIRVFASGRFIMGLPVHFEALTNPDAHVLLFTGAIALLTGLLCGAVPAMSASNTAPSIRAAAGTANRRIQVPAAVRQGPGRFAGGALPGAGELGGAVRGISVASSELEILDSSAIICCW